MPRALPYALGFANGHWKSTMTIGTDVSDLAYDARQVTPGALFVCVPGLKADGHDFAPEAVTAGAVALIVERPLDLPVPQLVVGDAREASARAADAFFGHPTRELEDVRAQVASWWAGDPDDEVDAAVGAQQMINYQAVRTHFFDAYRSYVINYNLGKDLVKQYVEARATSPATRWEVFERLLTSPRLPSGLRK